ncbi:MAG: Modification methylase BamHI [Pseudomonadota bacterium]|jgi:site-specific DNA-methyltransferase (adenine-specific)
MGVYYSVDITGGVAAEETFMKAAKKAPAPRSATPTKVSATPGRLFADASPPIDHAKFFPSGTQVPKPHFATSHGALFDGDCMALLPKLRSECIDTVFADPPFNLGKKYGAKTNDSIADEAYVQWCRDWVDECIRILKPGGSFFLYNLPRWNIVLGSHMLERGLQFRHWVAVEMSACLPITGRLHPSHYSLLYFAKGKPKTFRKIRTPVLKCRHCDGEIKDYGGHRGALNAKGLNLKDVWSDIPPVRHAKFKSGDRKANALSTKLLDRVVEMSTLPGEVIFDPFGGSGTTFAVAEAKGREWLGTELDFADVIAARLSGGDLAHHRNDDVIDAP